MNPNVGNAGDRRSVGAAGALAETDEVKSAEAARERRLKLQTDCSRALSWSKGLSAEETSVALAEASTTVTTPKRSRGGPAVSDT
jgi:hypothetical protein